MPLQPGDILLEKFRIEALIGGGAFGEVYRVTHLRLNVPRAIKILRRDAPGIGSSEFNDCRSRFQFEAQLGARLNTPVANPHLLQVHDFQEKGRLLLLEMEYASGGSLAERLEVLKARGESMLVGDVLQMGNEVAEGLSALHKMDIVHRDLKPSNILFDRDGHAKVADLGLAQMPGGPSQRTKLGQDAPAHPGTPTYMSPEQHNSRDYLPPASDVYTLGLVLFEALTGRMYRSQRPGTRASSLRQDVPGWLDDLLVRMLAEDPKERPWDGAEAAELLKKGLVEEKARQKEEAARREAEEKTRQAEQEKLKQAAEEQARQENEARKRRELEEQARRKVEEQARQNAETRAQKRAAEIERLKREFELALAARDRGNARQLILQLKDMQVDTFSLERRVDALKGNTTTWLPWVGGPLVIVIIVLAMVYLSHVISPLTTPSAAPATAAPATAPPATAPPATAAPATAAPATAAPATAAPATAAPATAAPATAPPATATPTHDIGSTWIRPADGMVMMYVPTGEFLMGSTDEDTRAKSDEKPQHTVSLDAYWIDKTDVTNGMYAKCVSAGLCQVPHAACLCSTTYYSNSQYDNYPAINISWSDANAYCSMVGVRLPTEAEWEKAARGTDGRIYPWGNSGPSNDLLKLYSSSVNLDAVGSYPSGASPYGVLDMVGNVWEWVNDWYSDTYYGSSPSLNPTGPASGQYRVVRGGSWNNRINFVRTASRLAFSPTFSDETGFRCARSAP